MRKSREFENMSVGQIHQPIVPADIREGDGISVHVKSLDPTFSLDQQLRVWRLSPLGVELIVEDGRDVPKGLMIDLQLRIGDHVTNLSGLTVDEIVTEGKRMLLHIRLVPRPSQRLSGVERRQGNRWICSEQFYPTAVASNPALFNDLIYFKVKDISPEGLRLYTSLRNKFIVPGMVFECLVNFPMISQVSMKVIIRNVRVELENGREFLALGVAYEKENASLKETIGQYLIQFADASSPQELLTSGFEINKVSSAVQYSFVRTKEEYEQVLHLRYLAYQSAGKLSPGAKEKDMADEFDARARIVIGKFRGEVVASARLVYCQLEECIEQEKYISWHDSLPRKDELVEIMRACTRPDFRGTDLLIGMFKFMAVTVAQTRRNWIVICATDEMVEFYKRVGFDLTGLSYDHPGLNNTKHHVMVGNFVDGMLGKTVGVLVWNLVWADSVRFLTNYSFLTPDPLTEIRLAIYRCFGPIANFIYQRRMRKAAKRLAQAQKAQGILKAA
jgi:predicted GNAT family N-acyltransferase